MYSRVMIFYHLQGQGQVYAELYYLIQIEEIILSPLKALSAILTILFFMISREKLLNSQIIHF